MPYSAGKPVSHLRNDCDSVIVAAKDRVRRCHRHAPFQFHLPSPPDASWRHFLLHTLVVQPSKVLARPCANVERTTTVRVHIERFLWRFPISRWHMITMSVDL